MVMLVLLVVLINTNGVRKTKQIHHDAAVLLRSSRLVACVRRGRRQRALKLSVREARKRNETAGVVQRLHTLHTSVGGAGIRFFP